MTDNLNSSQSIKISWDERVKRIKAKTAREAALLMWLGFGFYGSAGIAIFVIFGDRPLAGYLVMFLFQLCVLWFGTRKMYNRFSTSVELGIEAGRDASASYDSLNSAAKDMKRIRERVEKDTAPLPLTRRPVLEEVEKVEEKPNGGQ